MKRKTGFREWCECTVSLQTGCEAACRYCWARAMALRFRRIPNYEAWAHPVLKKVDVATLRRRYKGVVAAFGTHDITPPNLPQCRAYLEEMLRAGNRVLIVTKPHVECVEHLCNQLGRYREQIEWRFTVGSDDDALLEYWEPGAPRYEERIAAAEYARSAHYVVSFSVEPMLDPAHFVDSLFPALALRGNTIWVGKMNNVRSRVEILMPQDRRQVERIEAGQTDEAIMEIVGALNGASPIRWKDSIKDVIERNLT